MISAPMPGPHALAKASSTPVLPPGWPCMVWNVRVAKNHWCSLVPACPNAASRLGPAPVPNPSSETEELCTRTRDTATSSTRSSKTVAARDPVVRPAPIGTIRRA
jgi:hypothetical protein